MLEQADEVQEALGRSYGMPDIDEDELAAELEALGDDLAIDEDTSFLDDAIKAPSAPDKEPGASSVRNKVRAFYSIVRRDIRKHFTEKLHQTRIFSFQDGVLVDEFGLPQIPAS